MQPIPWAFCLALLNAGSSMAARMAMMAITTSSSIKVKARAAGKIFLISFQLRRRGLPRIGRARITAVPAQRFKVLQAHLAHAAVRKSHVILAGNGLIVNRLAAAQ